MPDLDAAWLARQRSHDAAFLLRRWKQVAKRARCSVQVLHETAGLPVMFLTSRRVSSHPLYFSAGVHGDEPAAVLGLLEWAERSPETLRNGDWVIVPIFNPAGLQLNTRADADGIDLNRLFDHPSHPHIVGWRTAMKPFRPRAAVCLHEDYDAQGLYGYELNRNPRLRLASECMRAASPLMLPDARRKIEMRAAREGIIRRARIHYPENLPEAVALFQNGTDVTLTFETPSEFSLAQRTRTQARLVQAVWEWDQRGRAV